MKVAQGVPPDWLWSQEGSHELPFPAWTWPGPTLRHPRPLTLSSTTAVTPCRKPSQGAPGGAFCIAVAYAGLGISSGVISCLSLGGNLSQQFAVQELHESLEISCDHLYPRLFRLIDITDERSTFQPNNLSGLTIGSKQCTATVRAKHGDSPIGQAAHLCWLSTAQPLNHILGLIDKEPWADIRQGDLSYVRIELDQIPRTRVAQGRSERVVTAAISDS